MIQALHCDGGLMVRQRYEIPERYGPSTNRGADEGGMNDQREIQTRCAFRSAGLSLSHSFCICSGVLGRLRIPASTAAALADNSPLTTRLSRSGRSRLSRRSV